MFRTVILLKATVRRRLLTGAVAATSVLTVPTVNSVSTSAQQAGRQPAEQATIASSARGFGAETGLVLNFMKEALSTSANPVRKQQAASWRVYKSPDPAASGSALYVFIVDPVVKGADYSVSAILAEAFSSAELSTLYKQYTDAYGQGQNFVNLSLVSDFGK